MQRRVLVRARDLAAFRGALVDLAFAGGPAEVRRRALIVPTRAAAELLRQTLERTALGGDRHAVLLPDLVTRDEWLARLHQALPGARPWLRRAERHLLLERAARRAAARTRMPGGPFALRPGLVAAMLDLYDELRRRQRSVRRFARALFDELRVERGTDRGSESLIHQTAFLGFAFLGYQRGVVRSGAIDEHVLRAELLATDPALPFDHVVIAVADHPSDPRGLWPADFDLIGRLAGLTRVDVVVSDETHDAGFRDRIEGELPGIEESRRTATPSDAVLVRPPRGDQAAPVFVSRDREEELRDVVRSIRARAAQRGGVLDEAVAVVFHRPLPYLYLGQQVFADGRVPYQALDALPLAAEPYAALLDLVLGVARTGGTREAAVGLLRSTLARFDVDGRDVRPAEAAALDAVLADRRTTDEADAYLAEVEAFFGRRPSRSGVDREAAVRAARAAAAVRDALAPFRQAAVPSTKVASIAAFLRRHERHPRADDPWRERHLRARAAVLGALDGLADGFARHDDAPRDEEMVTAAILHAIEVQTFTPRRGRGGVHLVDAAAARFGRFDHVHLVGLVETDWPERTRRSIFYTSGLLKSLGWPQQIDQTRAQQAAFRDLLRLSARTTSLHAFKLEGDGIVALSPMVDAAIDLPGREEPERVHPAIFPDEVLTSADVPVEALAPREAGWLTLRRLRPPLDDPRYSGLVDPVAPQAYRVSKVERYAECPFKYFAESVLRLPEERDEVAGLTPLERGTLVHELFERFYGAWQEQGGGTITPERLPDALALFDRIARTALAGLPDADRALEETRLLGSIVGRGLAERVFELEADAGGEVTDRLLEFELRGPFTFPALAGLRQRVVEIRGKTDRIDVFRDGSLRVIDYKLGKLPEVDRSIQIAVYAHAAKAALEARDHRPHAIAAAMYLAFGDDRKLEGRLGSGAESVEMAVAARAADFAGAVDRIEAGQFPAKPRRPSDCAWCRYAGVCRKEYLVDEDAATEPV
jgi:RecB family exonuclease